MRKEMEGMPKGGAYGKKEGAEHAYEANPEGPENKMHKDSGPDTHEASYGKHAMHGDLKHAVKFLDRDLDGEEGKEEGHMLMGKKHDQSVG